MTGPVARAPRRPRALVHEPVRKHLLFVEPLAAHLLAAGWDVTVVAPPDARERLQPLIDSATHGAVVYRRDSLWSLARAMILERYDAIFFSPRSFTIKHRTLGPRSFARGLVLHGILLGGFGVMNRRAEKIPGLHLLTQFGPLPSKSPSRILNRVASASWSLAFRQARFVMVYGSRIRERVEALNLTQKEVLVAPLALPLPPSPSPARGTALRVVLPGRIDLRLREYAWIDRLPDALKGKVELVFLGVPRGPDEEAVIRHAVDRGFCRADGLRTEFVAQGRFDAAAIEADLFLAPLREPDASAPVLGRDRAFGVPFTAVRYGKPMLLPASAHLDDELRGLVVPYRNHDELIACLERAALRPAWLDEIRERARATAARFTPDRWDVSSRLLAARRANARPKRSKGVTE